MSNKDTLEGLKNELTQTSHKWLVTGAAGFIGSNLIEFLLNAHQSVVALDNLSTGHESNIEDVLKNVDQGLHKNFNFIKGDVTDIDHCMSATEGIDFTLHQAALGSVPRSIKDPMSTHKNNVDGTFNMFKACVDNKVKRVVYASSSSVYGDDPDLPKKELKTGKPLSPYAASKYINEVYGEIFSKTYGLPVIGLRYFNVFGRRQDPEGAYAAVIPKWVDALITGDDVFINGDGETSRDFCYIDNTVQANIRAALCSNKMAYGKAFNVSYGQRTTLNELYESLKTLLRREIEGLTVGEAKYRDFRPGDVLHSLADTSLSREVLGYVPEFSVPEGLEKTINWYIENTKKRAL